jgi:uncharacterized protein YerC
VYSNRKSLSKLVRHITTLETQKLSAETAELFEVLTLLRDPKEPQDFLTDLLTPEEIERFVVR